MAFKTSFLPERRRRLNYELSFNPKLPPQLFKSTAGLKIPLKVLYCWERCAAGGQATQSESDLHARVAVQVGSVIGRGPRALLLAQLSMQRQSRSTPPANHDYLYRPRADPARRVVTVGLPHLLPQGSTTSTKSGTTRASVSLFSPPREIALKTPLSCHVQSVILFATEFSVEGGTYLPRWNGSYMVQAPVEWSQYGLQ